ncbi:YolD-like family protein [Paenibacillus sp. NPDC056579]|uniref:YolD-like family protein n=1 Tax=Paenibacillus sp. NPDC056579 TaxID=3345871 RepID=UPI0036743108
MTFVVNRENNKLAKVLAEALQDQKFVNLKVYDDKGDQQITGLVTKIDQESRRLKFSHEEGIDWIPLDDVLNAELVKG